MKMLQIFTLKPKCTNGLFALSITAALGCLLQDETPSQKDY